MASTPWSSGDDAGTLDRPKVLDLPLAEGIPSAAGPAPSAPATPRTSTAPAPTATRTPPPGGGSADDGTKTTPTATPTARPSTTTQDGWTVTTDGYGTVSYLRAFRVPGGDAVIRISGGAVSLVSATAAQGYSVSRHQSERNRLAVQFVGPHAYLVDVIWWDGRPYAEVNELG